MEECNLDERVDQQSNNLWRLAFLAILIAALFSRFYILGDRAISHDESIHTKFSWNLYSGSGFEHNPMMHGPLLFEVTALNYAFFGVNDFTSRIFPALVGVALVMSPLLFRRWLGRSGVLIASFLLLISPSISYYSRYIRHDVLLMMTASLWLWSMFKYLEEGKSRWLYWLAAFFSLMYATKEASYIYTAIFLVPLGLAFLWQVCNVTWARPRLFAILLGVLAFAVVMGAIFGWAILSAPSRGEVLDDVGTQVVERQVPWWGRTAAGLALVAALSAVVVVYYAVGEERMKQSRLFDLLMVVGTLTLPLGSAFVIKYVAGVDMNVVYDAVRTGNLGLLSGTTLASMSLLLFATLVASAALGLWWDRERWLVVALIHYGIFIVLYSTFFTWGVGILSGLIGSLAYWMAQHGVKRGDQPGYYYFVIGSLYEYLAFLFATSAGVVASLGLGVHLFANPPERKEDMPVLDLKWFFVFVLLAWYLLSWGAYSLAGERMPWLLVHIALPAVFLAAWWLGRIVESFDWALILRHRGWLVALALPLLAAAIIFSLLAWIDLRVALRSGVGDAGPTLAQLASIGRLIGGLLGVLVFGGLFATSAWALGAGRVMRMSTLLLAAVLGVLTIRTSVMLNFVNYDLATEFLVYAHGAPGTKLAMARVEEASWRLTGAPRLIGVAYGQDAAWPFSWYAAQYADTYYFGTDPDQETLLKYPIVLAGQPQWDAVEAVVGEQYVAFDYLYLWWPIQDYKDLTWERIRNALTDPQMRAAVWEIIWDRDYTRYAGLTHPDDPFTLRKWPFRKELRLYVRRDLAEKSWPYQLAGVGGDPLDSVPSSAGDRFAAGNRAVPAISEALLPDAAIRGIAVARNGNLYATDVAHHQIWHVTPRGTVRDIWGEPGEAPGQFREPWDVVVGPEGEIYVVDTWNHRIQKFSPEGDYLTSWGVYVQLAAEAIFTEPQGFFGPRGIAIGPDGEIYVADTGNKRIQIFDDEGQYLRTLGGLPGSAEALNEPVGVAVDEDGEVYVADLWNQRVVVFGPDGLLLRQWAVPVWSSESTDFRPYLDLGPQGEVFVSDPRHGRVLVFAQDGTFLWSLTGSGPGTSFIFPVGVSTKRNLLYVSETQTGKILGFNLQE